MRRLRRAIGFLALACLLVAAVCEAAPGTLLETVDFGEGVFNPESEFNFHDPASAAENLLAVLRDTRDMARCLRAIRMYQRRYEVMGEAVPRLRELLLNLKESKEPRAAVQRAFLMGLLMEEAGREVRALYIRDLAPLIKNLRSSMQTDAWAHLVVAILFGSIPELQGNWFDEALYAQCYGYDEVQAQLAVGSLFLAMDLSYSGNERLQWFAYLALKRALALAPDHEALKTRVRELLGANLQFIGYRPSKWLQQLEKE